MSHIEVLVFALCALILIGAPVVHRVRQALRTSREEDTAETLRECPELMDILQTRKRR